MKAFFTKTIFAVTLLFLPVAVSAHGAIFTYKYIDGDNLVMVTHNVHDAQVGAAITYNLRLYTMDGEHVQFQEAQARVLREGKVIAQQTAQMQNDEANIQYTYPEAGNYTLDFVFLDQDKQVAHGEFPIVVTSGLGTNLLIESLKALAAFLLGASALKLYQERRRLPLHIANLRKKLAK